MLARGFRALPLARLLLSEVLGVRKRGERLMAYTRSLTNESWNDPCRFEFPAARCVIQARLNHLFEENLMRNFLIPLFEFFRPVSRSQPLGQSRPEVVRPSDCTTLRESRAKYYVTMIDVEPVLGSASISFGFYVAARNAFDARRVAQKRHPRTGLAIWRVCER